MRIIRYDTWDTGLFDRRDLCPGAKYSRPYRICGVCLIRARCYPSCHDPFYGYAAWGYQGHSNAATCAGGNACGTCSCGSHAGVADYSRRKARILFNHGTRDLCGLVAVKLRSSSRRSVDLNCGYRNFTRNTTFADQVWADLRATVSIRSSADQRTDSSHP